MTIALESDEVIELIDSEEEDADSGVPVYRIRSYPADPDLETLFARWTRGEICIPEWQRGFVWKPTQASKLIESFLMGLPVPGIYVFVERDDERQLVIDGQQRLRSVFGFMNGEFPDGSDFILRGVDERWEGKRFNSLEWTDKARLLHSILRITYIEQLEPVDKGSSIYQIFERLNTGGTALTPQEIRNSSYHGQFNDMLRETNKEPVWRKIFGTPQPDARMRDVELIARFLALQEGSEFYTKPMKQFISDFMFRHQKDADPLPKEMLFMDSVRRVVDSLGERPFHIRRGINVAAYDAIMVAFANSPSTPTDISERYKTLLGDTNFIKATTGSTTDLLTVKERLDLANRILFE